jgi:hypothetical protein
MDKGKRVYEAEVMALPPLRLVIGDIPSPDPDKRNRQNQPMQKPEQASKGTVKRLIAHLEEE